MKVIKGGFRDRIMVMPEICKKVNFKMILGQTISQMITHDGVLNLQAKNICQEESDKNIELSFLLNR